MLSGTENRLPKRRSVLRLAGARAVYCRPKPAKQAHPGSIVCDGIDVELLLQLRHCGHRYAYVCHAIVRVVHLRGSKE